MSKNVVLDLGCGKKKRPGAIGVDYSSRHDADVIHNLDVFPYPFESNSVDEVFLDNVLEHLLSPIDVMQELHRICKEGAKIKVIVPYFRSMYAFIDPTHRHFFTVDSFAYYDPDHIICKRYDYVDARFKVKKVVFNETLKTEGLKRFVVFIANKWPQRYERYLSHIVPLEDITYYLVRL